ncbi:uncharacterized protein B0H64DRAFT_459939 [Chaetomium fimeti]|uniref:NmrA-like domain-containing protein n=1 Tax=Chaetomium fimeti TaxID=1854472 RepID=A0AAE0HFK3_9PEZI|nr:hypothetical protein B0H64DRAFT_459939 [Chaetomium fimeti]
MAQKYARDQPPGFTNRVERVAIVGAGGQLGSHLTTALLRTGRHTITALTRRQGSGSSSSTNPLPAGVIAAPVDYDDEATLEAALRGQQFLIITLAVTAPAPAAIHTALVRAAGKVGVRYVMPNGYGADVLAHEGLMRDDRVGGAEVRVRCAEIEATAAGAGSVGWVSMVCGFWYEYSLVVGPVCLGFDHVRKRVTLYDGGETRVNLTTFDQCARAVAALLSLKELSEDEGDEAPTVSRWRNKPLYVASFLVSQREMLESWKRVTGEGEWTVESEPSEERYRKGLEMMQSGTDPMTARMGAAMASFARIFYPDGCGDYESSRGLANGPLGLPKEDLDERTRVAKKMLDDGYPGWVFQRLQNAQG